MELVRLNKMCLNETYVKVCKGKYLLQFSYIPAIATELFFILLQSFTTTCFGPYGPSSVEHISYVSMVLSMPQRIHSFVIV
jgi:hypothetical protein